MNKIYIIVSLLLITLIAHGQTKKMNAGGIEMQLFAADTSLNSAFCSVGYIPEFPGGTTKLVAFAKGKIKYPKTAINDNVQGAVILQFIINEKGYVTNKKILHGVRYDLDSACLKMLNQMPKWKAGRLNGKAIAVVEEWRIIFILID